MQTEARYAIGDLAALGGVSRRTVRYYVQVGLIPPPLGIGRGNHYSGEHLAQLLRVKAMQEAGRTLEEIRRTLGTTGAARGALERPTTEQPVARELWRRVTLAPGVELHVASGVPLPPPARIHELAGWWRNTDEDSHD